jgi:hypothetical protein
MSFLDFPIVKYPKVARYHGKRHSSERKGYLEFFWDAMLTGLFTSARPISSYLPR